MQCTLTQGAFGASNGAANGPNGLITQNPSVLPVTVGGIVSVTLSDQASLIAFLQTGGTSNMLCGNAQPAPCPASLVVTNGSPIPDPSGSGSEGYGGGVLTGQTIALTLNASLSSLPNPPVPAGLSDMQLPVGPFCTCDANNAVAGPFEVPSIISNLPVVTVSDLLALANAALQGTPLSVYDSLLTYGDITAALDAINKGFDTCRSVCPCN